jgi:hypothetical protein
VRYRDLWLPFADLMIGVMAIFMVATFLLFLHVTEADRSKKEDIKSPGSLVATAVWHDHVDVDLWVKDPGDAPVGFNHRQGKFADLLRDDRGNETEMVGDVHYENVFVRNTPKGEYIVNVHLYADRYNRGIEALAQPINVEVEILLGNGDQKEEPKTILKKTVKLINLHQEITVARFLLDDKGLLVDGSVNDASISIRQGSV